MSLATGKARLRPDTDQSQQRMPRTTISLTVLAPPPRRGHTAESAYSAIRDAILSGLLLPGTPLSVPEIARRLGTSRTPAHEAVQRLVHEGLATNRPRCGAAVAGIDPHDALDLLTVWEPLEGLAAALAATTASLGDIDSLRAIIARHNDLRRTCDAPTAHADLDLAFHREIRAIPSNRHLSALLESIATQTHNTLAMLWHTPNSVDLALQEHEQITAHIEAGDTRQAEQASRQHIAQLRIRLQRVLRSTTSTQDTPERHN